MRNRYKNYLLDGYLKRNQAALLRSGTGYFSRVEELIRDARYEIHLQTYIFEPDQTGQRIARALKAAAARQVKVFLFLDAFGSKNLSGKFLKDLRSAGIHVRKFGKIYSRGQFHIGRRLHRKVIVADGERAIVGGMNISNNYNDNPSPPAWLDFALDIKGNAALRLLLICRHRWLQIPMRRYTSRIRENLRKPGLPSTYFLPIRISQNDFIRRKNEIAINYREAIRKAEHSLLIVGGYFLPGGRIRRLLRKAIERGVDIKIVVSESSDVSLVRFSRQFLYQWLLRNKIQIYEFIPSNVHGKLLIADKKFLSIGSYDLNNLSTYSNIELNLDISDPEFCTNAYDQIDRILKEECRPVNALDLRSRFTTLKKFRNWLAYRFTKILFVLSLLLVNDEEED